MGSIREAPKGPAREPARGPARGPNLGGTRGQAQDPNGPSTCVRGTMLPCIRLKMIVYSINPSTHHGTPHQRRKVQSQGFGIPPAPFSGALRLQNFTPHVVSYTRGRSAYEKGRYPQEFLLPHQIVGHPGLLRLVRRTQPRSRLNKVIAYSVAIYV